MLRRLEKVVLLPVVIVAAVVTLPLVGALIGGVLPPALFAFPPPDGLPADYPPCSWFGRVVPFGIIGLAAWAAYVWWKRARSAPASAANNQPLRGFPAWGWCAVGWTAAWWLLSWTRFPWFAFGQLYTFFPLWLGFIVTINSLTWRRRGSCLMFESPRLWLSLFFVSAAFWWGFEWLNRFVGNWHYLGEESFGATGYAVHASICFSTVLPAVLGVREWLATHPEWLAPFAHGPKWRWLDRPPTGAALLAAGIAGLVFTGARPLVTYPALWTAPLLLAVGMQILVGRRGWWSGLTVGDWRDAAAWALAALICGGFWETWNYFSAAKWIYTIPYMDCWHIFEMPLAGYLGYLPFGLQCAVVVRWFSRASQVS